MTRHSCSLCQTCYERQRPWRYFPETFRDGTCCGCGDYSFIARVTRAEADEQAEHLFGTPADRPHNQESN